MPFDFFDHTGDIAVDIRDASREGLFGAAAEALTSAITDLEAVRPAESRRVAVAAADLDLLLVDWLSELLYLFDAGSWLTRSAAVELHEHGAGWRLEATVRGEPFDGTRHAIKVLVKAVTYHRLEVRRTPDGWHATVVFDV